MKAALGESLAIQSAIADDNSQWVHIMPAGRFQGRDGRGPYELVDPAGVMSRTRERQGRSLMVVDFEHQSIHAAKNGQPAPAAGWISGLKVEADGLWALVKWTAQAATAIRDKSYRYLSPVFNHDRDGRVTQLVNVALTNSPNLELTALARSQELSMDENEMAEIRKALGLQDTATVADILAAIASLQQATAHSANPDPAMFVPIGDFERVVAEANKLRQGVSHSEAVAHVEQSIASGKVVPFLKDWAVSLCSTNKPAFDAFLDRTGPAFSGMFSAQVAGGHAPGAGGKGSKLTDEEKAVCSTMGLTEEQFLTGRVAG